MPDNPTRNVLAQLTEQLGEEYALALIEAGAARLEDEYEEGIPPSTTSDEIAAAVLLGALSRIETAGAQERQAFRDAEADAQAATLRAAYRAAKNTPHNPLEGLIRLADAAGVDLDGDQPVPVAGRAQPEPPGAEVDHLAIVIAEARLAGIRYGGYTLARAILQAGYSRISDQDRQVLTHATDGWTGYRFTVPGQLLAGWPAVTLHGDEWHLEQEADGQKYAVVAEDEVGAILALIAQRAGLVAVFKPADSRPEVR